MASPLQEGDAPCVRGLLLEHFRDPHLEIEGKLGRRSLHKFTAGLGAEQFRAVQAQLLAGAPQLGLPSGSAALVDDTVDHFYAEPEAEPEEQERPELTPPKQKRNARKAAPNLRSSFACDEAGCARGELLEAMFKTRLSDCHVGSSDSAPPEDARVDIRVSFSREVPAQGAARRDALVYRRRKRRQTFESPLYLVQLTHVDVMDGNGADGSGRATPTRELFEVEVELRMETVRPRMEEASNAADEALCITRELVAALRYLASLAVEAKTSQKSKKRKRLEGLQSVEPALRAICEGPEAREEMHRLTQEAGEGRPDFSKAKHFLFNLLKSRHPVVSESDLYHVAGKQVARIFHSRLGRPGLAAAAAAASQVGGA